VNRLKAEAPRGYRDAWMHVSGLLGSTLDSASLAFARASVVGQPLSMFAQSSGRLDRNPEAAAK